MSAMQCCFLDVSVLNQSRDFKRYCVNSRVSDLVFELLSLFLFVVVVIVAVVVISLLS